MVWPAEYIILAIWAVFGLGSYLIKRKDKTVSSDFLGSSFESIIDEKIDDRR
ncbi:hypothetical protein [Lentilactobacillus kisonensis]|uniref:hypothetical protein n=1 Tax=Lentilactobacillus kisonensis TaxID=481722 RepID=UPI001FB2170E|nr:hypothetical protein [Lentilactobacillus kisonensis]